MRIYRHVHLCFIDSPSFAKILPLFQKKLHKIPKIFLFIHRCEGRGRLTEDILFEPALFSFRQKAPKIRHSEMMQIRRIFSFFPQYSFPPSVDNVHNFVEKYLFQPFFCGKVPRFFHNIHQRGFYRPKAVCLHKILQNHPFSSPEGSWSALYIAGKKKNTPSLPQERRGIAMLIFATPAAPFHMPPSSFHHSRPERPAPSPGAPPDR